MRNSDARSPGWARGETAALSDSGGRWGNRRRTLELFAVCWSIKPLAATMFTARPTGPRTKLLHFISIRAAARPKCDFSENTRQNKTLRCYRNTFPSAPEQRHRSCAWAHSEPLLGEFCACKHGEVNWKQTKIHFHDSKMLNNLNQLGWRLAALNTKTKPK